jgi:hypothetical protein
MARTSLEQLRASTAPNTLKGKLGWLMASIDSRKASTKG